MNARAASNKIPPAPDSRPADATEQGVAGDPASRGVDATDEGKEGLKNQTSAVGAGEKIEAESGDRDVTFTDETGRRGRVVTMIVGNSDHTITREQVLPAHATDAEVDAAKERLQKVLDGE